MNKTQAQIIHLYKDLNMRRPPSFQQVADKVGCSKTYVAETIKEHNRQNEIMGLKKISGIKAK